jgi:hypothetical protein
LGTSNETVIGENVPQPSICVKRSRAEASIDVGATRFAFTRRPVRLVGSGHVVVSLGSGISGSGRCAKSKRTAAPGPSGVRRRPLGARSMPHEAASAASDVNATAVRRIRLGMALLAREGTR